MSSHETQKPQIRGLDNPDMMTIPTKSLPGLFGPELVEDRFVDDTDKSPEGWCECGVPFVVDREGGGEVLVGEVGGD